MSYSNLRWNLNGHANTSSIADTALNSDFADYATNASNANNSINSTNSVNSTNLITSSNSKIYKSDLTENITYKSGNHHNFYCNNNLNDPIMSIKDTQILMSKDLIMSTGRDITCDYITCNGVTNTSNIIISGNIQQSGVGTSSFAGGISTTNIAATGNVQSEVNIFTNLYRSPTPGTNILVCGSSGNATFNTINVKDQINTNSTLSYPYSAFVYLKDNIQMNINSNATNTNCYEITIFLTGTGKLLKFGSVTNATTLIIHNNNTSISIPAGDANRYSYTTPYTNTKITLFIKEHTFYLYDVL